MRCAGKMTDKNGLRPLWHRPFVCAGPRRESCCLSQHAARGQGQRFSALPDIEREGRDSSALPDIEREGRDSSVLPEIEREGRDSSALPDILRRQICTM